MPQINKKDILNSFNFRHACKEFDKTKIISDDDFATILEAARLSPSSFGLEPWRFLVIKSEEAKQKLDTSAIWGGLKQLKTCSHYVIILHATSNLIQPDVNNAYTQHIFKDVKKIPEDMFNIYMNKAKEHQINNNVVTSEAQNNWLLRQSYIPLANMMSVAAMLGIDSCPIEGFIYSKISENLKDKFNIDPKAYQPAVMVAFGYRKMDPMYPKSRLPSKDLITFY